jgi:hypothetical protein
MAFQRRRIGLAVLCATPMGAAHADHGWDGVGMVFGFGILPLLALLAAFVLSLFVSRAPWRHKLWTAIAIAACILFQLILGASHAIDPPLYAVALLWIIPAAAWWASATWLRRRR